MRAFRFQANAAMQQIAVENQPDSRMKAKDRTTHLPNSSLPMTTLRKIEKQVAQDRIAFRFFL
jgi:hypothetical protein